MKVIVSLIHRAKSMMRIIALATAMISVGACAQSSPRQAEAQARSDATLVLPEDLLGTWHPYGRGYQRYGDLLLDKEVLSWGACQNVRYRVFRRTGAAYYIEQIGDSPCDFSVVGTKYLVLVATEKGLEVSICRGRDEFEKPPNENYCSWGTLNKNRDETDR